ncbi:hypothetical protein K432DRAFT_82162 [Lepidopterella palustris CBS 459.81]|uniref:Uncharacterized protein n=1 Tax=Lepidopterella palustris CBS 459.81 TaxID=1314670 RepID=A0A8E2EJ51_9PEZI|nr:hypothetical protein K432DRAFT_82162 [Lepidopterella palustris CBS 459.81]
MKRASDSPQNPMQQPPSPEIGTLRKPMNKPGMNLVHPLETVKEVASNSPLGPRLNGTRTPPEDQLTEPQPEPLTPQRTATDNSAKESDGAVSPNTKFSIPHSRREGRETKTVHPKDNYNRSASPGAIIPSDVIAPTTLPPSSPRALGLTSTSAAPKTQSVSDTGSSQKSLNPISRVDFQESPQTRPSKSMKPPPLPPSTNPNVNSMSLSPPKRSKRHSTASVELTDFRMYDLRKRGKGQISLLQSIDDIPGNDVIEYDPESNICIVKDKRDIARLIQSREADCRPTSALETPQKIDLSNSLT